MTRDDIIRMAREAEFIALLSDEAVDGLGGVWADSEIDITDNLSRFAALVAAAEREKVARWIIHKGYCTGHGDTTEDLLTELEWQVAEREREECAKICEEASLKNWFAEDCVALIRARGE